MVVYTFNLPTFFIIFLLIFQVLICTPLYTKLNLFSSLMQSNRIILNDSGSADPYFKKYGSGNGLTSLLEIGLLSSKLQKIYWFIIINILGKLREINKSRLNHLSLCDVMYKILIIFKKSCFSIIWFVSFCQPGSISYIQLQRNIYIRTPSSFFSGLHEDIGGKLSSLGGFNLGDINIFHEK